MFKWIKLLILLTVTGAMQLRAEVEYCFNADVSLKAVRSYLGVILAPKDIILLHPETNCLEVNIGANREELFEGYLSRRYKLKRKLNWSQSNQLDQSLRTCRLISKKINHFDHKKDRYQLGRKGSLKREEEKGQQISQSLLVLGANKEGVISVDGHRVTVLCSPKGTSSAELDIKISDKKGNTINTTVNVAIGQETNLGGFVEDLKQKNKTLSTSKGVDYEKSKGQEKTEYLLILSSVQ